MNRLEMPWYKRLRWRLVGIQIFVVIVGVGILLLATRLLLLRSVAGGIRPILAPI